MLVRFVSAVLIAGSLPAFAQAESAVGPYLVRVECIKAGATICVLLCRDRRFLGNVPRRPHPGVGGVPAQFRIAESSADA
jgi:hypothetical protein